MLCSCQYENAQELYDTAPIIEPPDTTQTDTTHIDTTPVKQLLVDLPFNGTIEDISDNEIPVVTHGGVVLTSDRFWNDNHALFLNGENQFIELNLEDQDSVSVAFWFNCSSGISCFSSLFDYGKNAIKTNIDGYSGPTSFYITSFYNNLDELHADFYFQYFMWYHIYVSACSKPVIYVNGENAGEIHKNIILNLTNNSLVFGKSVMNDTGDEKHFYGVIDDIKIFNYALSDQEIKDLYNKNVVKK
ncbi:LamG-like jellyroll fold domain-containing protein [Bacteroidota bacterium]